MYVSDFQITGLTNFNMCLYHYGIRSLEELNYVLRFSNITFRLTDINRFQSTVVCMQQESYVQSSQRYIAVHGDDFNGAYYYSNKGKDYHRIEQLFSDAIGLYKKMTELTDEAKEKAAEGKKWRPKLEDYKYGIPIEDARYILPLATKTTVQVSIPGERFVPFLLELNKTENCCGDIVYEILKSLPSEELKVIIKEILNEYKYPDISSIIDFYNRFYFSRISSNNKTVLFDKFRDLVHNVAMGALTSTTNGSEATALLNKEGYAEGVIRRVTGYGHTGIMEQARMTFGTMMSLSAFHQFIRHRIPTNTVEPFENLIFDSQRPFIVPETIKNSVFYTEYVSLVKEIIKARHEMLECNQVHTLFQYLLNCEQIKVIFTDNARSQEWMLRERTCQTAQWEIRELSTERLKLLLKEAPVLFEKSVPPCVYDKCKEGGMTCGKAAQVKDEFSVILKKSKG